MASATLKIFALDKAQGGYPAKLSEAGKPEASGLLPVAAFGMGKWRIHLDPDTAPPKPDPTDPDSPRDIVDTVATTKGEDRPGIRWDEVATALFDLLLPIGPLRDAYSKFANDTELFLDIDPPELARVPWELARSSKPARRLSTNYALSRLHAAPAAKPSSDWPFRILIVVGCKQTEEESLGVAKEVEQIRRVFLSYGRSAAVCTLYRPSWPELKRLIQSDAPHEAWEPHVLHFVGHTALAKPFGLMIEAGNSGEPAWVWSADAIQEQLPLLNWIPQFVFLNACRTQDPLGGAWGMQHSFVEAGVQAVLTLQADVNGSLGGLFAGKLYERIAAGMSVQAAAREARMSIYGLQQDGDLVDWALPSLSAASPSLALFTPRAPPADPDFDQCEEFESARMFANCDEGRRLLTTWLCPTRPVAAHARPAHVVLLTGSSRSGKSHLLKWAMESWILGGARVRYIELHDGTALGFVSILRLIRDGTGQNGKGLLQRRLPTAPFRRFTWTLVNRLKTGRPGEWNEAHHPGDEVADDFTLTLLPANGEKRLEPEICAEFHAALQQVAEERPLVLVFDKFTSGNSRLVSPDDFELIVNHLFKPIAQDKSSRVKLVFCANALEREIYKLSDLPQTVNCSVPANITDDLLADYAVEMMRFDETYPAVTASTLRAKLKVLAEAVFGLPTLDDPLQQPQGMAKLGKLDSLLKQSGYNKPPRMR